ncbi:terminase large subunit [Brevundimonas sp.]
MARKATPTTRSSSRDRATRYAKDVVAGRIVAGPHVRNAARRHLRDLTEGPKRGLVWDLDAAERVWNYFEGVLRLSEGQFEGKAFKLDPSQAFILGSIFGWQMRHEDGGWIRRYRRAYIEQGKGNGKSPLVGGIGLYGLASDKEAGAQVYAAGATKDQAGILFADAVKMVKASKALTKRLKFSGGEGREYNIAHLESASFFRPVSRENRKSGSGPRPHFALCDEVHEHPDRGIMETLERGFKFRRQPLLVMITNSGSDRKTVCWEEHQHAVRVAAGTRSPGTDFGFVGDVIDDTTFAYVCALDEGDDPLHDPSCWIKANPLLGTILTESYLAGVVAQAKAMPGKLNGILRLHFCVWTDAERAWISRATLEKVLGDFDPLTEHAEKTIATGVDLSAARDLTAVAHVVRTGEMEVERPDGSTLLLPTFDAWIEAWTPGDNIRDRSLADEAPYDEWANEEVARLEGREVWLHAVPGERIRLDHVAAHFQWLDQNFDIGSVAYDRYGWRRFEEELDALGLDLNVLEHPQGGKRKAKPTEAQVALAKSEDRDPPEGLWMPGSLNELEQLIIDGRIRLKPNPVLISACMSAAINDSDPFGNRWFEKRKSTQRIDPLVSLAMAIGAALSAPSEDGGAALDDFIKNAVMV